MADVDIPGVKDSFVAQYGIFNCIEAETEEK